ncbi:DeoR/GlpR transcriptional regulator [Roseospira marina]|uniref:DeoR/GlpR transcriptional regulator n=1 Tax=Roseospira marina TaxID=140057 RepID=A0A5M6I9A9_9PROT|nr:DeoR/GlpR family DNA-binding transcription regulator [Roseospira marina]KAA5604258.1 DeoR/GlpR transcriptional regulator [Roseospira marina]MBB4315592.1 DeoR/GlpR family transcriptional regulator of sugar metabolism [Roseospira marina]MBB5088588.1 DeoR/GlpR family transcriptional regulator of sugar metabolism [Roseospira marina]
MIPAERQHFILSHLANRGVMSIAELASQLDVSRMTVRRDIQHLEQAGRVMSVSGGVRLPERLALEPSHVVKAGIRQDEKARIGRVAASLVPENAVLYLDAGTTSLQIARNLTERRDLIAVTNDFEVASFLMRNALCQLYHTGGLVERENQSCVGEGAAEAIRRFNFDIAFVSASSWTINGLSTPAETKVPVKKAVVQSAARSILVCDSSKYGIVAPLNAIPLDLLDAVISDRGLSASVIDAIRARNVDVILAD